MTTLTAAELEYVTGLQEAQKRNRPNSVAWLSASKEIHAVIHGARERASRKEGHD